MKAEQAAKKIVMLICDVDGVLTDGGLYYDELGKICKRFDVQDGLGIKLAQSAGLEVAIMTGLESEAVRLRMLELGIREYHAGKMNKFELLKQIKARNKLEFKQMAYLGDDWVDAQAMQAVGLPMAVNNAQPEIKELAFWISNRVGGHGAVREALRFILKSQEKLESVWQKWLNLELEN